MLSAYGRMDGHHGTRELIVRAPNDNYDVLLYRKRTGDRTLWTVDVLMRLEFEFAPGTMGAWNPGDEQRFMREFERVVRAVWATSTLLPRTQHQEVGFRPVFDMTARQRADEHWMMVVTRQRPEDAAEDRGWAYQGRRATRRSPRATNVVLLNQLHNWPIWGSQGEQYRSAHEYGHMLNNWDDEYERRSARFEDHESIMHSGNLVRARHLARFRMWAEMQIERVELREREEARRRQAELERFRREVLRGQPAARDAYRHLDERQRRRLDR